MMKPESPPNTDPYVILGAGGHAAVLIDALLSAGAKPPLGALCPDAGLWGQKILGAPILGDDDLLAELASGAAKAFAVGVGSVGDTRLRRRLFELGLRNGLKPLFIRHPTAIVAPSSTHGAGFQLLAGAIVGARATIGRNVLINTRAVVEHDCHLDDHVHVATGAILCGAARVGEGAHVGAGAVVNQGVAIGEGAIIGAGAVVVRDAPAYSVCVGVPAKAIRETT
jgi:UDP-perosamine 4-acetyltransferase